jgi:hypothetical protein
MQGGFMNLDRVLSEIDLEISRLQQAKQLLSENAGAAPVKRGPGRPPASAKSTVKSVAGTAVKKRTMSAAGRARIAAAQKARWAKSKKAAKKASVPAVKKSAGKKAAKKATGKKLGRPAGKTKAASQVEAAATPAS